MMQNTHNGHVFLGNKNKNMATDCLENACEPLLANTGDVTRWLGSQLALPAHSNRCRNTCVLLFNFINPNTDPDSVTDCSLSNCSLKSQQVVKVMWHKAALLQQTDGSIVFARWNQCPLPWGHIGATWWVRLNLSFLQPTRVHNPNGRSVYRFFAQLTAESPYTLQWAPLSPNLPLPVGESGIPSSMIHWAHNPNGISRDRAVLAQITAECSYTLQ